MTTVVIDASNICREHQGFWPLEADRARRGGTAVPKKPNGGPQDRDLPARLSRFYDVVEAARRQFGPDTEIRAWADESLRPRIDDRDGLDKLIREGAIRTAGEADDFILQEAELYGAVVISGDNYRSKRAEGAHAWLNGTTDRVYTIKVTGGKNGPRRLQLAARSMGDIGASTLRRARNDEQIKARGVNDDDLANDYRCTNTACVQSTKSVLSVLPVRVRSADTQLYCPTCSQPVTVVGPRTTPVARIGNRRDTPSSARPASPALSLGALPSLGALSAPAQAPSLATAQPTSPTPAATLARPAAEPAPAPAETTPRNPQPAADPPPVWAGVRLQAKVKGTVVVDEHLRPGTTVTLGRSRQPRSRDAGGNLMLDVAAPLGADYDLVSRTHLRIVVGHDGGVELRDGSRNGIWADGTRLPTATPVTWTGQTLWLGQDLVEVTLAPA